MFTYKKKEGGGGALSRLPKLNIKPASDMVINSSINTVSQFIFSAELQCFILTELFGGFFLCLCFRKW